MEGPSKNAVPKEGHNPVSGPKNLFQSRHTGFKQSRLGNAISGLMKSHSANDVLLAGVHRPIQNLHIRIRITIENHFF